MTGSPEVIHSLVLEPSTAIMVAESFFFAAPISAEIAAFGVVKVFGLLSCADTDFAPKGPIETATRSISRQSCIVRRFMATSFEIVIILI